MQVSELTEIDGMTEGSIELLSAGGVEDLVSLAQSDSESLFEEMEQAKAHLQLEETVPARELINSWIEIAQEITGKTSVLSVVRLEEEADVLATSILEALPVKKDYILKHEIAVGDVPLMEEFVQESEMKELVLEAELKSLVEERPVDLEKGALAVREIASRALKKRTDEEQADFEKKKDRVVIAPLKSTGSLDIRKAVSREANLGKKLYSRRYIRGVLHPQVARVRLAAFVTLMTLILIPASFVAAGLVLLEFSKWLLLIPGAFLIFGLLYFMIAKSLKCRICGQPLYSPKSCLRHDKSHRIPLIGYILPTCLHALFFHWFRCTYCGTSIRLKE